MLILMASSPAALPELRSFPSGGGRPFEHVSNVELALPRPSLRRKRIFENRPEPDSLVASQFSGGRVPLKRMDSNEGHGFVAKNASVGDLYKGAWKKGVARVGLFVPAELGPNVPFRHDEFRDRIDVHSRQGFVRTLLDFQLDRPRLRPFHHDSGQGKLRKPLVPGSAPPFDANPLVDASVGMRDFLQFVRRKNEIRLHPVSVGGNRDRSCFIGAKGRRRQREQHQCKNQFAFHLRFLF